MTRMLETAHLKQAQQNGMRCCRRMGRFWSVADREDQDFSGALQLDKAHSTTLHRTKHQSFQKHKRQEKLKRHKRSAKVSRSHVEIW